MNVHCRWESAAEDERCIAWAREIFAKSQPFASSGAYINFLTQDETDRIAFAYGATYDRLVRLKKKYDPTNLSRMNQKTSGVGYVVWYAALPGLTALGAATVQLCVPIIAAAGGALMLAEGISLRLLVASLATLGGIALTLVRTRRK
jgi:hypothetical protein